MTDKVDFSTISYLLGILSIVFAFVLPFAGLVLGIVGIVQSSKLKFQKAKKLNMIGIILSAIFIAVTIITMIYSTINGTNYSGLLPSI